MPGAHYALSEALIVASAVWVGLRFTARQAWFAAAGVAILGLAAAIGVLRFGTGAIELLAGLHRGVSQTGGAVAMALIAMQFAAATGYLAGPGRIVSAFALALLTLLASAFMPGAATVLFVLWLVVAIALAASLPAEALPLRLARALAIAVMLANVLLVRQSPMLGPDLSWHLFHVLVAIWLGGIWWALRDALPRG